MEVDICWGGGGGSEETIERCEGTRRNTARDARFRKQEEAT